MPNVRKTPCPYCFIMQSKFARHIERRHEDHPRIKKIIEMSASLGGTRLKLYRRKQFRLLAREGCAQYNLRLRQRLGGAAVEDLIPVRRSSNPPEGHLECPECYGLFKNVRRHKCPRSKSTVAKKTIKKRARRRMAVVLLEGNLPLAEVIATMHEGEVKAVIMSDELLLQYANHQIQKIVYVSSSSEDDERDKGTIDRRTSAIHKSINESRKESLRSDLRLLARYLLLFRQKYDRSLQLLDTFRRRYVHYTHRAVIKCTLKYSYAAQTKKLTSTLTKLYEFAKACSLEADDLVPKVTLQLQIDVINAHVRKTRMEQEIEDPSLLPTRKDLATFRQHLDEELAKFNVKRKSSFTYKEYVEYCKYAIARITLYNLRRSGEVASMSDAQFKAREVAEMDDLPAESMSVEQLELAKEVRIVSLRGKSEHHQCVFAILTRSTKCAIKRIRTIKRRFELDGNPYVFAIKGEKQMHTRGNKAFEEISKKLGLPNITAGKVRKVAATNAAFEADPRRKKLLSSVLAHDLSTHHRVYEEHMCSGTARFFHVPALLDYVEIGRATILESIDVTLPAIQNVPARGVVAEQPNTSVHRAGIHWSEKMIDIVRGVFEEEIENPRLPITIEKAKICHEHLAQEGVQVTIAAVRSKAQRIVKESRLVK